PDPVVAARARDDEPVPGLPAGDRLGQCHDRVALAGGPAELDPGAAQRGAVEVHAAAAADDGRAGGPGPAGDAMQPDEGAVARRHGPPRRADEEGGPGLLRVGLAHVRGAVEAVLVGALAGPDLDQPDVQARVPVGCEGQRPADVDGADYLVGAGVVEDGVPGA